MNLRLNDVNASDFFSSLLTRKCSRQAAEAPNSVWARIACGAAVETSIYVGAG